MINLTTAETAARLRITVKTLCLWRSAGRGPRYMRIGKRILYAVKDIEQFEQSQLRQP